MNRQLKHWISTTPTQPWLTQPARPAASAEQPKAPSAGDGSLVLGEPLQTIDGFQGFWVHVRAGSLPKAPDGGWVFSRFISPANEAAW